MATVTRRPDREQEVGPRAAGVPADGSDDRWVEVEGQRYRRRNPVTEYVLAAMTLGVWALVWHYRANDDARRFLRDRSIRPGVAVMGFMTGMAAPLPFVVAIVLMIVGVSVPLWAWIVAVAALLLVPLPLMVTVYRTGQRVARMQEQAGVEVTPFGLAGVLLSPALLHIPLYQSALNEIFGAGPQMAGVGLMKGLTVTLKHLLSRSVTQQYPHEKPDLPARTRGVIALKPENCTVCWKCSRECPDWCIYIDAHKETHAPASGGRARSVKVLDRFAIDYALCMYCGICVEVCPFDALFWSPEFEYSVYDLAELTHEKEKLQEWTYTVLPPPELEAGAEPVETAPAGAAEHSEAPTSVAPMARPNVAEPERRPATGAPPTADVPPPVDQAAQPPQAQEAPAPAETTTGTPAAGEEAAPQKPAPEAAAHVEPDQETHDRVLKEQLDAGTDRRVAEGRAKSAAIRAARQKAQG